MLTGPAVWASAHKNLPSKSTSLPATCTAVLYSQCVDLACYMYTSIGQCTESASSKLLAFPRIAQFFFYNLWNENKDKPFVYTLDCKHKLTCTVTYMYSGLWRLPNCTMYIHICTCTCTCIPIAHMYHSTYLHVYLLPHDYVLQHIDSAHNNTRPACNLT